MFGRKKLMNRCQALEKERDYLVSMLTCIPKWFTEHVETAERMDDESKYRYLKVELALDGHYILSHTRDIVDSDIWKRMIEDTMKECKQQWDKG